MFSSLKNFIHLTRNSSNIKARLIDRNIKHFLSVAKDNLFLTNWNLYKKILCLKLFMMFNRISKIIAPTLLCLFFLIGCDKIKNRSSVSDRSEPISIQTTSSIITSSDLNVTYDLAAPALSGNMNQIRHSFCAIQLTDNRVIIVGGHDNTNVKLSSVEIYNPSTNSFTNSTSLNYPRHECRAVLLDSLWEWKSYCCIKQSSEVRCLICIK